MYIVFLISRKGYLRGELPLAILSLSLGSRVLIRLLEPTDIVASTLTHINYAFADVTPDTGNIKLTDSYADEQVRPAIDFPLTPFLSPL